MTNATETPLIWSCSWTIKYNRHLLEAAAPSTASPIDRKLCARLSSAVKNVNLVRPFWHTNECTHFTADAQIFPGESPRRQPSSFISPNFLEKLFANSSQLAPIYLPIPVHPSLDSLISLNQTPSLILGPLSCQTFTFTITKPVYLSFNNRSNLWNWWN